MFCIALVFRHQHLSLLLILNKLHRSRTFWFWRVIGLLLGSHIDALDLILDLYSILDQGSTTGFASINKSLVPSQSVSLLSLPPLPTASWNLPSFNGIDFVISLLTLSPF